MIQLTPEQRQALSEQHESPPRARDPDAQITYVLVREEVYERAKAVLTQSEDQEFARDLYPHVMEVFGRAGWDDPTMDVYNELDPRRQP
jgi:hypothetical protein